MSVYGDARLDNDIALSLLARLRAAKHEVEPGEVDPIRGRERSTEPLWNRDTFPSRRRAVWHVAGQGEAP